MYLSVDSNRERFFGKPFLADEFFYGLSGKALGFLSKIKHRIIFQQGQVIYDIGELPKNIYILREGSARLFIAPEQRPHFFVRSIMTNEVLGLPELLSSFRYEAGVEASSLCVCEYIRRDDVLALFESDPQLCFRLLGVLGSHLQGSYKTFSSLEFRGLPE